LLPHRLANAYARLEPFGFVVIVVLLATRLLGEIMHPPMEWVLGLLRPLTGI